MTIISLINAAKYYKNLPGQNKAFDYLTSLVTFKELEQFAEMYRNNPVAVAQILPKDKLKLLAQVDNNYEIDGRRGDDGYVTCLPTSAAMIVNAVLDKNIKPYDLDIWLVKQAGSRYSWANICRLLETRYALKTNFSTNFALSALIDHLAAGNLAMVSTKFTAGGHVVVAAEYNKDKKAFKIYDPYSEWTIQNRKPVYMNPEVKRGAVYWCSANSLLKFGMNNGATIWANLISNA